MGRSSKSHDTLAKQLALFALMVGLWTLNLFPIQRAERVLTASAVVSNPRLPSLQRVSEQEKIPSDSIRWVHYQRDLRRTSRHTQSNGLQHIQLRLGIHSNASHEKIQKELQRLTQPTVESDGQSSELSQLRAERWRLKTIEHQMSRFELDREQERQSLEIQPLEDQLVDQSSDQEQRTTRAQGVVYRKLNSESASNSATDSSESPSNQKTWESLLNDFDRCAKQIERIENQMRISQVQASGTIEITGSPHLGVLSTRASIRHSLCVLAFTLLSCVGLFVYLRDPSPKRSVSKERNSMLKALDELGIQNFGTIAVACNRSGTDFVPRAETGVASESDRMRCARRIEFARRIVDGLLVLWVACFAIRFLSDSNWRELLFSAPLSAFSSLVFGI
ncbi:MAG: hypothetical protein ACK5GD_15930 [Planctomycetota bacterium]|jgi:hypothetical protein